MSEEDAVNILLEALSRQPAAADDKAEEVYAVDTARAIFRDAERVAEEACRTRINKRRYRSGPHTLAASQAPEGYVDAG